MAEYVTRGQRSGKRRDPSLQQAVRAFGDVAAALSDAPDSPDTDHLLHMIGDRMCELVGVSRCSVYLRDGRTGLFRGQVGRARSDIDARVKRLVAGTYADRFTREILETGKAVVLDNAANDPRPIRSTMRRWGVTSMLGVPMVFRGEVIGVVYLDDEDGAATFSPLQREIGSAFADLAAVMVAQAQGSADMREALETAQRQNHLLRRSVAVDERLARALVEERDLGELVREVGDVIGKPVVVYDASLRRRALHRPRASGKHPVPDLEDPQIGGHPAFREAIAGIGPGRSRIVGPLPAAGIPQRLIVAEVSGREGTDGFVVVVEAGAAFGAIDAHVARRTAVNAAVLLSLGRRLAEVSSTGRGVLVADLLLNEDRRPQDAARIASMLGLLADRPHVVCVAADLGAPSTAVRAEALADALRTTSDDPTEPVVVGEVGDVLAAVVPIDRGTVGEDPVDAVRNRLHRVLQRPGLSGTTGLAVSEPCSEPEAYADAFADARQVLTCMERFRRDDSPRLLSAADLGAGRIFVATAGAGESERFAHRALRGILGDGPLERDLLATLQAFFASSRSVRRSATALRVHENTIRYRLSRIEEATGLGVTRDARDQLTAELALLVLQLRGECPWSARAGEDASPGGMERAVD